MKPIHVYLLDDMSFTLFRDEIAVKTLQEHGIVFSPHVQDADVLITRFSPKRNPALGWQILNPKHRKKKVLVWTHEPRFSTEEKPVSSFWKPDIHFMNLYTGDVYLTNYAPNYAPDEPIEFEKLAASHTKDERKGMVALATYINTSKNRALIKRGINIDLTARRQDLLLYGRKKGQLDIYGKHWPDGIAHTSSRDHESWRNLKTAIMQSYRFNVALENTNYDYYVTEKLWDSIKGGCLPVYYGSGNRIYESFDKNSFIDLAEFEDLDALFSFLKELPQNEFLSRLESCVRTYNEAAACSLGKEKFVPMAMKVIDKLRAISW